MHRQRSQERQNAQALRVLRMPTITIPDVGGAGALGEFICAVTAVCGEQAVFHLLCAVTHSIVLVPNLIAMSWLIGSE